MSPENRSDAEIREDLRRAASTATGFCHDAAMRLAGDFESLLARIAAVEALHFTRGRNILGKPVCAECSPLQPMPCPTLRALAASPTPTGPDPARECGNCGEPFPGEHMFEPGEGVAQSIICPRHTASGTTSVIHDGFIGQCDQCAIVGPATPTEPTEETP